MPKKSRHVPATLIVAVAAGLVAQGCGPNLTEVRRCVDQRGYVLPDDYCDYPGYYRSGGVHVYIGSPVWVYGGGGSYSVGGYATGYRSIPTNGATIVNSRGSSIGRASGATVSRGGFGSIGAGRSTAGG